jgi:hypothetical protein
VDSTTQRSREDIAVSFRALRALKASFGPKPNKDDRMIALIGACIIEGFDTEPQIIGALRTIGMKEAHARALLRHHDGVDAELHAWRRGPEGRYVITEGRVAVPD